MYQHSASAIVIFIFFVGIVLGPVDDDGVQNANDGLGSREGDEAGGRIVVSLGKRLAGGIPRARLLPQIFRRAAILFVLGLAVYMYPHFNLGRAFEAMGRLDQALEHFQSALRENPGYALAAKAIERVKEKRSHREHASPSGGR